MRCFTGMLLLLPCLVFAGDGVREINPACVSLGCFSGDSPGFPVEIQDPGSYRLTGNLDVSGTTNPEFTTAITITAEAVTLDLNGFSILGPVSCTGTPVTGCSPSGGDGDGIHTPVTNNATITIMNGVIRGMGDAGIQCWFNCTVENVKAVENGGVGFSNSNGNSLFVRTIARRNGAEGFFVAGLVKDSIAVGNTATGIFTNTDSRVVRSRSAENGGAGVRCGGCSVIDNVIGNNAGFGIEFVGDCVYGRNLIDDNALGSLDNPAGGLQVDTNRCGTSTCP